MSYVEQMLKKAVDNGVIKAYAINGSWIEMNTGTSLIRADTKGALEELKEMSPVLFEESEIIAEESSVEKPKRKRTTKTSG